MSDPLVDPLAPLKPNRIPAQKAESAALSDATPHPQGGDVFRLDAGEEPQRVSRRSLAELADRLSQRDRQILQAAGEFRLVQADQIRRLLFSDLTTESARARICRQSLQRLTDARLLHRLQRRVGGTKAGSSGCVYTLAAAGRRLRAYWHGEGIPSDRGVHEPGLLFVSHTLAIADLYVRLVEADRAGQLELLNFEAEPTRTYLSPLGRTATLKPDALVALAHGEYEHVSFCEIDLATEGRGALLRKCRAYLDYYRSGREQAEHGLFPRVAWVAPTATRTAYISRLLTKLPPSSARLFIAAETGDALAALSGADTTELEGGER